MKRFFAVVLAAVMLLALSACGENSDTEPQTSAVSGTVKAESEKENDLSSETESSAQANTSNADKSESGINNTSEIPETDVAFDESCAFLGNSILGDLDEYELVDSADVYSYVGMNVASVFDQKLESHKSTLLEEMLSKDYKNIFIMFGMNELGWSYHEIFFDDYAELVDEIHQRLPEAKIYLLSVTPITKALEDKGEDGLNTAAISELNTLIEKVAAEHEAVYLNVGDYLKDENGYLAEDDSPDGYHLQPKACMRLVDAIKYLAGDEL